MRKHLTPEERQLVLDYGLQNLQKGPDGGDEIDGRLILVRGTVTFLAGRFKFDQTNIQRVWNRALESYSNDDTSGGNLVMLPGFMHSSTGITAPAQCCWYQVGRSMVPGCTFIHSLLSAPLILLLALLYLSLRIL